MWVLSYCWTESEEFFEEYFDSAYEAENEATRLIEDGAKQVRIWKETFNRIF